MDLIESGAGAGQTVTFHVYLTRRGDLIAGTGQPRLSGHLIGCELQATFNEPGGDGRFDWVFTPDDLHFAGSFDAPGYGNAGSSSGERLSS